MEVPSRLGLWDFVTMSLVVIMASSVGLYHVFAARSSKNAREFLVTSHDLGLAPLILSAVASFISAIGILGFPVETYTNGAVFIGFSFATVLLIPMSIYLFLPIFFNLGTTTIFEYLEFRFNRSVRLASSIIMNFQLVLYTSCVIYAPALALNQVTGMNLWASVVSIGIICIIYTSMGGLKAVVWADAAQMLVMITVLTIIAIKGISDVGGLSEIWRIAALGKRDNLFQFSSSPHSVYTTWTVLLGGTFHFTGPITINQVMMQRYLSNSSLKKAKISFIGGCIGIMMMTILATFTGLTIYARYHDCDPLLAGLVTSRDQLMALFGIETLSFCNGLPGVFVGAILCATLSTLSSTLNSLSAVTMEDYIRPYFPNIKDTTAMKLSMILGIVYGVVCVALVALAESMGGVAKAVFSISGMTTGPVLSLFTVGMLFPWVSTLGASVGCCASILFNSWACIGSMITKPVLPSAPLTIAGCLNGTTNSLFLNETLVDFFNETKVAAVFGDAGLFNPTFANNNFALYSMPALWYTLWSVIISTVVSITVSLIFGNTIFGLLKFKEKTWTFDIRLELSGEKSLNIENSLDSKEIIKKGVQNPSDLDPKLVSPLAKNICMLLPETFQEKLGYGKKKSKAEQETYYMELPLKLGSLNDEIIKIKTEKNEQD